MGLRKWVTSVLVVLVILSMVTPCVITPCTAWTASKRLVTLGDFIFGGEFAKWKTTANLFHSQKLAATDTEALAIAFPVDALGQTVSPSIAQTAENTATASDTGFFDASWCFTSVEDVGGYTLTPDVSTWHPMRSSKMVGSGISWPSMAEISDTDDVTMKFQPTINTSPDTGNINLPAGRSSPGNVALTGTNIAGTNQTGTNQTGTNQTGTNQTGTNIARTNQTGTNIAGTNQTGTNRTAKPAPTGGSKPNTGNIRTPDYYKNMTKGEIKNLSGMDKMFRNANRKNTIPLTYKGTVDRPTVIAATKNPMDIIKPADKQRVLNDSVNMTRAGTNLRTLFWDL